MKKETSALWTHDDGTVEKRNMDIFKRWIALWVWLVSSTCSFKAPDTVSLSCWKTYVESQDTFEQAENAGRFAGNDTDSKAARSLREDRDRNDDIDAEARKDLAQTHDYKGESQNVDDDTGMQLTEEETKRATNKANEGLRQGRSDS